MPIAKVRLRFAKKGDLRLVSHHDLMRCLERMLRRAALPVAFSQGFNPRPKVVFPLAMGLGIEGLREVVELELAEPLEPSEVLERLSAVAPEGLTFIEAEPGLPGRASQVTTVRYALPIPEKDRPGAAAAVASFWASSTWPYLRRRPDRTVEVDLRPFLLGASLDDASGMLRFELRVDPGGSARPEEIVDALGLRRLLDEGAVLVRTDVELAAHAPGSPGETNTDSPGTQDRPGPPSRNVIGDASDGETGS